MKHLGIIAALILLFASSSFCQSSDCPCGATKGPHRRKAVKNRAVPASISPKRTVKIREMIRTWDITNEEFAQEPAQTYPREDSVFRVSGYLHRANISGDDCDIHIEIAASRSHGAKHVIVEIPNTQAYCAVRQKFIDGIIGKEKVTDGGTAAIEKLGKTAVIFKSPPKITVTGYAFLDTGHWSKDDHQRGNKSHGSEYVWSLWEIHPVLDISVE